MADSSYTRRLAEYSATARFEDLPETVRERAKHIILDGLGCGLFGARLDWSKILTDALASLGNGGPSVVWGTDLLLPPDHAALANGSFVQAFEIDDGHIEAALHQSALVLPPALAALDIAGPVSGADLLAAIVVGFEVGPRVGMCVGSKLMLERGWHSGAVIGTFAAAAAAGRVLGLTPEQMAHAFGIAGTQSSGLMSAQFGSMVKRMHHGRAAQSGLYGALLARNGYTGIEDIFELRYGGFCTTYTASSDRFDLNRLIEGLGTQFETERTTIKPYACNTSIHTSLDAIRNLRERRPFSGDEVSRITVRMTKSSLEHVGWEYKPGGMTAAQMNLSFCLAAMIERGDVFVDEFTEESIRSPRLLELARRVSAVHDPELDTLGPRRRHRVVLTLDFTDGSSETEAVEDSRGSPGRPLSNAEIVAKYDRLARTAIPSSQADELKARVLHMEDLADGRAIAGALKAS